MSPFWEWADKTSIEQEREARKRAQERARRKPKPEPVVPDWAPAPQPKAPKGGWALGLGDIKAMEPPRPTLPEPAPTTGTATMGLRNVAPPTLPEGPPPPDWLERGLNEVARNPLGAAMGIMDVGGRYVGAPARGVLASALPQYGLPPLREGVPEWYKAAQALGEQAPPAFDVRPLRNVGELAARGMEAIESGVRPAAEWFSRTTGAPLKEQQPSAAPDWVRQVSAAPNINEQWYTRNILLDPTFWTGYGGPLARAKASQLRGAAEMADIAGDLPRALRMARGASVLEPAALGMEAVEAITSAPMRAVTQPLGMAVRALGGIPDVYRRSPLAGEAGGVPVPGGGAALTQAQETAIGEMQQRVQAGGARLTSVVRNTQTGQVRVDWTDPSKKLSGAIIVFEDGRAVGTGMPPQRGPEWETVRELGQPAPAAPARAWIDHAPGLPQSTTELQVMDYSEQRMVWPQERQQLHEAILSKRLAQGAAPAGQRTAVIIIGVPGAGKTQLQQQVAPSGFVPVDVDDLRGDLPEYQQAVAARARDAVEMTDSEAAELCETLLDRAMAEGKNVVVEVTGSYQLPVERLMGRLREAGYRVDLKMPHVPEQMLQERVLKRAEASGRYMAPEQVSKYYETIPANFEPLARQADTFELYDMSTRLPRVVWRGGAGQPDEMLDEAFVRRMRGEEVAPAAPQAQPAPAPRGEAAAGPTFEQYAEMVEQLPKATQYKKGDIVVASLNQGHPNFGMMIRTQFVNKDFYTVIGIQNIGGVDNLRVRRPTGSKDWMRPERVARVKPEALPAELRPAGAQPAEAAPAPAPAAPAQPDFLTPAQRRPTFGAIKQRGGQQATTADLLGKGLAANPEAVRAQAEAAGQVPMFGAKAPEVAQPAPPTKPRAGQPFMDAKAYLKLPEGTRVEVYRNEEWKPGRIVKKWEQTGRGRPYQYNRVLLDGENRSEHFHWSIVRVAQPAPEAAPAQRPGPLALPLAPRTYPELAQPPRFEPAFRQPAAPGPARPETRLLPAAGEREQIVQGIEQLRRELATAPAEYREGMQQVIAELEGDLRAEDAMSAELLRVTGKTPEQATLEDWRHTADTLDRERDSLQMRYTPEGIEAKARAERGGQAEQAYAFGKETTVTRGRMSQAERKRLQAQRWQVAQGDEDARVSDLLRRAGYSERDLAQTNIEQRRRLAQELAQGQLTTTKAGKPARIDEVPEERRAAVVPQASEGVRQVAQEAVEPGGLYGGDMGRKWDVAQHIRARKLGEQVGELPPIRAEAELPEVAAEPVREPWQMTRAEFEEAQHFSSWDEIRQEAPYVSKANPKVLVTVSPSTVREGNSRLNFWSNRGIEYHLDVADAELEATLRQETYPRGQTIVTVQSGIGGTYPSESYAGFGFQPQATAATGVKSFVGPKESADWMVQRLESGGYGVEVRDVPEDVSAPAGPGYWQGMKQLGDHDILVQRALEEGKPVPAEVLADYPALAPKAAPDWHELPQVAEPAAPERVYAPEVVAPETVRPAAPAEAAPPAPPRPPEPPVVTPAEPEPEGQWELVHRSWQQEQELRTLPDKLRAAWQRAIVEFVDRFDPIKNLPGTAYRDASLVSGAVGRGESLILQKAMPVLKPIEDVVDDFTDYLVAMHNQDILEAGARRAAKAGEDLPPPKLPAGVQDPYKAVEEMRAKLAPEVMARIEKAADQFWTVMDDLLRGEALRAGHISDDYANRMRSLYPHYVPFYRQGFDTLLDIQAWPTRAAAHAPTGFSKRMKEEGSLRRIKDPLTSIMSAVVNEQVIIARNEGARALLDGLREVDPSLVIPGDKVRPGTDWDTISVWEDGQKKIYGVPAEYARVAKGMDAYAAGLIGKIFRGVSRPLRVGATKYNPRFFVRNVFRDAISAYWTEGLLPFEKAWWEGMAGALTRNELWHEAAQAKGFTTGIMDEPLGARAVRKGAQIGAVKVRNWKDAVLLVPRLMAEASRISEQGTRLAVFRKLVKQGVLTEDAAYRMANSTVNFDKSGNATRVLNQAQPFLNARLQGTVNFLTVAKKQPKKAVIRALPLVVPCVLFYLWNRRFEDTNDQIPSYEWTNNWIFQFGEGTLPADPQHPDEPPQKYPIYIKIPKGDIGAALTAAPEAILRYAFANEDRSATEMILRPMYEAAVGLSPIEPEVSSLTTPGIGTALEVATNRNFYTGRAIVPEGEKGRPGEWQYGAETTAPAVAAGKALGVSPRYLEHIVKGMTGGAGQTAMWAGDVALKALGYEAEVPGEARRRGLTGAQEAARAPYSLGLLGATGSEKERQAYRTLDDAVLRQRDVLYTNAEVRRFGLTFSAPGDTYTVGGVPQKVQTEQRAAIVERTTPVLKTALDALTAQGWYKGLDDAEKQRAIDTLRGKVTSAARASVLSGAEPWTEANARELVTAMQQKREYDAIPRYRGLTPEQVEAMTTASRMVSRLQLANKRLPRRAVVAMYAKIDPEGARLLRLESRARNTRQLRAYWDAHLLLARYFGNLSEWEMSFIRGEDWREELPVAVGQ